MIAQTIPIEGAETMAADELIPLMVAQQVLAIVIEGSMPGERQHTVDPDAALDGVLLAVACMMEQAPEFPTTGSLRKGARQFAGQLEYHARAMRKAYELTGVHPIDRLLNRVGAPYPAANSN